MKKHELKIEVPNVFYPCFINALSECWQTNREIKLIEEEKLEKSNSCIITVSAKEPETFFYLGKHYAQARSKL